jgi:hypothetical protein
MIDKNPLLSTLRLRSGQALYERERIGGGSDDGQREQNPP